MSHINKNGTSAATVVMGFDRLSRSDSRVLLALATAFNGQRKSTYAARTHGVEDGWDSYQGMLGKVGRVFDFSDVTKAFGFLGAISALEISPDFRAVVDHQKKPGKRPAFA